MDIHTSSPHPSFSEQPTSEHQSVKTPQVQAIIPLLLRIGPFPPNPNVLSTIHRYSESRHPAVSRPAKPRDPRPPVRGKALSLSRTFISGRRLACRVAAPSTRRYSNKSCTKSQVSVVDPSSVSLTWATVAKHSQFRLPASTSALRLHAPVRPSPALDPISPQVDEMRSTFISLVRRPRPGGVWPSGFFSLLLYSSSRNTVTSPTERNSPSEGEADLSGVIVLVQL